MPKQRTIKGYWPGFLAALLLMIHGLAAVEKVSPTHQHVLRLNPDGGVSCKAESLVIPDDGSRLQSLALEPVRTVRFATGFSTWEVTYQGFTPEAQAAFQRAVDIWARYIKSPVTIRVNASFSSFGPNGPLGYAGPESFFTDPGNPDPRFREYFIPSPLVDMVAGEDVDPDFPDISAEFNRDFQDWYFGLDGNPPFQDYDFVSVVLHELGHGLGFVSSLVQPQGSANVSWGLGNQDTPVIFDRYLVNSDGAPLVETLEFPNGSPPLLQAVTSNDVYFDGFRTTEAAASQAVPMFAPSEWDEGSSIAHLNEWTYPESGPQALMTPFLFNGEAQHQPGTITLAILGDMGWDVLTLVHFAQFASGSGILSDLVLTNPSSVEPLEALVRYFDPAGVELDPATFMVVPESSFQIPPLGSLTLRSRVPEGTSLVQGSALVSATRPVFGVVRFDLAGSGVAGVGSSQPAREVALPVRREGSLSTGAAIRNVSFESTSVLLTLRSSDGTFVSQKEETIEAGGRLARFIQELFNVPSSFRGTLVIQAGSGEIAVVGLELEPGARFTTLPVSPTRTGASN